MDRTWMYNTKRAHPTFLKEAGKFVDLAKAHAARENLRSIFCPCKGNIPEYGGSGIENEGIDFDLEDMLRHFEPEVLTGTRRGLDNWEALEKAAKELLYDEAKGCDKDYSVLRSVLELLRLKARHGWSDTSFNDLMDLLRVMLPKPNLLPTNTYEVKKLICPLSLGVQKIHACENHCLLYRKEFADLDSCPTCGTSRYKMDNGATDGEVVDKDDAPVDENKKIARMVMWYLPVKDRLKRLYSNRDDAELMRWHQEGRKIDGKIQHPADARQWKNFDALHPEFAKDPRNVKFALSTDGMNPFGDLSSTHSTWPVLLTMYNLPTWICQKRKYILLSILIQGPRQPGINVDVFLEPLMEDMQELWEEGLRMWDEYRREHFTLHAIIFIMINDLLANFSLSGQFKGKFGCLICIDKTSYKYLTSLTKGFYMRHRQFLPQRHRWRAKARLFDNTVGNFLAPETRTGRSIFELTKNIKVVFGKPKKKPVKRKKRTDQDTTDAPLDESNQPFKKNSIFFRCLHSVKVPTGFSANVRKLVSLKDLTISGYNAHDCHKMLTNDFDPEELGPLQSFAIETACQLEMFFPPAYFNMMEHLIVHIVPQIIEIGQLYLNQMWAYKRYMSVLKGYVRNRAHPEGSMIEGYTTKEVVECCIDYMKDAEPIGVTLPLHEGRLAGTGIVGKKRFYDEDFKDVAEAHSSILQQLAIVEPYIQEHMNEIRARNPRITDIWICKEQKQKFPEWLKEKDLPLGVSLEEKTLCRLANGPTSLVISWQGYDISGNRFYTMFKDRKSAAQNSGVRVEAFDTSGEKKSYYGIIQDIWELDYGLNIQILVLRCQWVRDTTNVFIDDYGLTVVDRSKLGHKDNPWVLAERVAHVFYVSDPSDDKMAIAVPGKQNIVGIDSIEDASDYNQYDDVPLFTDFPNRIKEVETSLDEDLFSSARKDGVSKIVKH
ncbi:uncharacterized protein [Oryza sativa Japonica Group]|uniref:uncharacterized protein n=1 Tax=Oryza sativa subsp. japonica TaxID=39947 RepID=UPI00077549B4|nr:uncharacterized protein LOC107280842 [Oryza sativa Japonica Group]